MKRWKINLLVGCFYGSTLIGCIDDKCELKLTDYFDESSWKQDSLASLGYRNQQYKLLLANESSLLKKNKECIINKLGKPNDEVSYQNGDKAIFYIVYPGKHVEAIEHIVFTLDKNQKVKSVRHVLP
jgi:hypothetical protein